MAERIVTGRTGEAHVTSRDDRTINGSIVGRDGLYVLPWGDKFKITFPSEYKLKIGTGVGLFQGVQFMVDEPIEIDLEANAPGTYRRDRLYVEYTKDSLTGYENVSIKVRTGDASTSSSPAVPPVIQENIWDGDGESFEQSMAILYYSGSDTVRYMNTWVEVSSGIISHVLNQENPHQVTKTQIGLGNVDNTSDKDKEVKSADVSTKLKKPFKLTFDGDLQGTTSIDGSEDVTLRTTLKGGTSMPFSYKLWEAVDDNDWRNFLHGLFPIWVDKNGTNREILQIVSATQTNISMYTAGNYCKIGIRLNFKTFSEDEMDKLSLYALRIDPSILAPIIMQYDKTFSFSYLPLYNAKARLEYIYNCTLNYPKKGARMCSVKSLPCAFQGLTYDSEGNPETFQLTFDGTSFLSAKSVNDEWEPAIIAKKNGVTNPTYLYIELEFPCDAIGGSSGPANYIEIGATEISTQNNTMYSGGVE